MKWENEEAKETRERGMLKMLGILLLRSLFATCSNLASAIYLGVMFSYEKQTRWFSLLVCR